jgi:hypothetical protein
MGRASILALAFGLATTAAPVLAQSPGVAVAFGNTILSTYPDGRIARLWLQPNGRFEGHNERGVAVSGHWRLKGARVCLRQARPIPIPLSFCTPAPAADVGVAWTARAATGEELNVKIVEGR